MLLKNWLLSVLTDKEQQYNIELQPMAGDAGFRQYYRFNFKGQSLVVVDAPPKYSNNEAFVAISQALNNEKLNVPKIIALDLQQGFLCITDFGNQLLADTLVKTTLAFDVQKVYSQAISLLPAISKANILKSKGRGLKGADSQYQLPIYDQGFIELELKIFSQWLLEKHLNIELSDDDQKQLEQCFSFLTASALSQPKVTIHRDYHSRNIMVLNENSLGIIDFQDAVIGPITYDIVSLLRDCYTRWPDSVIQPLFKYFCQLMAKQYSLEFIKEQQWQQWFDLMGIQRHLKASGIFCRLYYRDNKGGYLNDIPLTLSYIKDVSAKYPELSFLHHLIKSKVLPAMQTTNNKISDS
jgi:hypothetical protein